jgi:hypothetical protein
VSYYLEALTPLTAVTAAAAAAAAAAVPGDQPAYKEEPAYEDTPAYGKTADMVRGCTETGCCVVDIIVIIIFGTVIISVVSLIIIIVAISVDCSVALSGGGGHSEQWRAPSFLLPRKLQELINMLLSINQASLQEIWQGFGQGVGGGGVGGGDTFCSRGSTFFAGGLFEAEVSSYESLRCTLSFGRTFAYWH